MGKEAERAPRGPLTSRRTRRPPAGRARTRAPAPGGNPCREARPGRLRGCARGPGWGAGRGGEARSPPRQPRGAAAAAAAAATLGEEPCGAQPEQVCCAASGAPPTPSPRGRRCRGSRAACGEGRGARVRSTRRPPGPGQGVRAPGPFAGSSRAGALRESSVSWGPAKRGERQTGRKVASPAWARKAGCSAGKSEPGRKRARGVGACSAGSARTGGDRRGVP